MSSNVIGAIAARVPEKAAAYVDVQRRTELIKAGALQNAILNSANFSIIAIDSSQT